MTDRNVCPTDSDGNIYVGAHDRAPLPTNKGEMMKNILHSSVLLTVLIMGLLSFIGCEDDDPVSPSPTPRVLIVANQNSSTLTLIDLKEGGAVSRDLIGVGLVANDMVFYNGNIHVINSSSHDMNVISLSLDNELDRVGDPVDLGIAEGTNPQYGAVSVDGKLYISNALTNDVTVINLEDMTLDPRIPVGVAPADVIVVGDNVYVCNTGFNFDDYSFGMGSVSVISVGSNTVIDEIDIGMGKNPQFMDVDPSGRIHVICTGNYVDVMGEVAVIAPSGNCIDTTFSLGGNPGDIAINSNGIAYVAAGGWGSDPGKVFRYNTASGAILNGPDNPIDVSTGAMRVAAATDNSVYVSCMMSGCVDRIDADMVMESYVVGDGPVPMIVVER